MHKFRTNSRRVEALLDELAPRIVGSERKLLSKLSKLRKKAGRVRDLDVGISTLRTLKIPEGNGHKSQFLDNMVEERGRREAKLAKAFERTTVSDLAKRIKRAARDFEVPVGTEPLTVAVSNFSQLIRDHQIPTERTLHRYRIVGKRTRYIAELAGDDPEAKRLIDQLKQMQDVIGDWHDWLKLTEKAESLFGSVRDSALVAVLRNVTQAKFRQSVDALAEIRSSLAGARPGLPSAGSTPSRRPVPASQTAKAVAA